MPRELGRWQGRRLCMEGRTRSAPRQALSFLSVAARFLFSYDKSKQRIWRTLRLFSAPQARQRARLHTSHGRDSLRCGVDGGITQKIRFQEARHCLASSEDSGIRILPVDPAPIAVFSKRHPTRFDPAAARLAFAPCRGTTICSGTRGRAMLRLGRRPAPGGAQRFRTSAQKGNRAWTWDSRTRPHG